MPEPGRILLVEDDPNEVALMMNILSENNLANEVVVVNDGAAALDYLHCREKYSDRTVANPIVVLLDLKLPKIDGLEVLKQIRSDDKLKLIPVVILTSSHEPGDIREAYGVGANAYIVKPIDFSKFAKVIKEIGIFWTITNEPSSRSTCEMGGCEEEDRALTGNGEPAISK